MTSAATGRALCDDGSRPQPTGPDECKGDKGAVEAVRSRDTPAVSPKTVGGVGRTAAVR